MSSGDLSRLVQQSLDEIHAPKGFWRHLGECLACFAMAAIFTFAAVALYARGEDEESAPVAVASGEVRK